MGSEFTRTKRFIIRVTVISGEINKFRYKVPAEYIKLNGFLMSHNHSWVSGGGTQVPSQIANVSISLNNKSSNPINFPIIDKDDSVTRLDRKVKWLTLDETPLKGEYIEGFIEDLGLPGIGDYVVKLYFKGLVEYN